MMFMRCCQVNTRAHVLTISNSSSSEKMYSKYSACAVEVVIVASPNSKNEVERAYLQGQFWRQLFVMAAGSFYARGAVLLALPKLA